MKLSLKLGCLVATLAGASLACTPGFYASDFDHGGQLSWTPEATGIVMLEFRVTVDASAFELEVAPTGSFAVELDLAEPETCGAAYPGDELEDDREYCEDVLGRDLFARAEIARRSDEGAEFDSEAVEITRNTNNHEFRMGLELDACPDSGSCERRFSGLFSYASDREETVVLDYTYHASLLWDRLGEVAPTEPVHFAVEVLLGEDNVTVPPGDLAERGGMEDGGIPDGG